METEFELFRMIWCIKCAIWAYFICILLRSWSDLEEPDCLGGRKVFWALRFSFIFLYQYTP